MVRRAINAPHQADKDLAGQMFGRGGVSNLVEEVAIDGWLIPVVDLGEGG